MKLFRGYVLQQYYLLYNYMNTLQKDFNPSLKFQIESLLMLAENEWVKVHWLDLEKEFPKKNRMTIKSIYYKFLKQKREDELYCQIMGERSQEYDGRDIAIVVSGFLLVVWIIFLLLTK